MFTDFKAVDLFLEGNDLLQRVFRFIVLVEFLDVEVFQKYAFFLQHIFILLIQGTK